MKFEFHNEAYRGSPLSSLKKFQVKRGDSVKKLFELMKIYLKIKLVEANTNFVRAVTDLIRAIKR